MAVYESGHIGPIYSLGGVPGKQMRGRQLVYSSWVEITTATDRILNDNPQRIAAIVVNSGDNDVAIRMGDAPVIGPPTQGMILKPGGAFQIDTLLPWTGSLFASFSALGGSIEVEEISIV